MTQVLTNTQVILTGRPDTNEVPSRNHFKVVQQSTLDEASLKEGQIIVKTFYLSLDPYLIRPMGNASQHGAVVEKEQQQQTTFKLKQFKDAMTVFDLNDVFGGRGVGRVIASKHSSVSVGDYVAADWKWQEYAVIDVDEEATFEILEKDIFSDTSCIRLSYALGMLSVSGSHALWGFNFVKPKELDNKQKTIVISAAGGSIGLIVGQLAMLSGLRVVGIAGGADKCDRLKNEFGFDAVVDYKLGGNDRNKLTQLIRDACPQGIDAYFDNVGGVVTEAVDNNINSNARVYFCGAISMYPSGQVVSAPERSVQIYKEKNVEYTTCLNADYISKIPEARRELYQLIKQGKLKPVEFITSGIENTPVAFEEMYRGKNFGKALVKVYDE